jgi:hypothetical protein
VVDADGRPVGMLDITDLIGLDPPPARPKPARHAAAARTKDRVERRCGTGIPACAVSEHRRNACATRLWMTRAARIELLLLDVDGVLTDGASSTRRRDRGEAVPRPRRVGVEVVAHWRVSGRRSSPGGSRRRCSVGPRSWASARCCRSLRQAAGVRAAVLAETGLRAGAGVRRRRRPAGPAGAVAVPGWRSRSPTPAPRCGRRRTTSPPSRRPRGGPRRGRVAAQAPGAVGRDRCTVQRDGNREPE